MKSIDSKEFFKLIAINSGVNDLETVRNIYYGMIRTISRELRDRQSIKLPDWGEFILKIQKSRRIIDVNDRQFHTIPAKPLVKFSPEKKVKQYFYTLG